MKKSITIKLVLMFAIIIVLLIPIAQIKGLVAERYSRHQDVIRDIAARSSTAQVVIGPVLVQPYTQTVKVLKTQSSGEEKKYEFVEREGNLYFLPEDLNIDASMHNETRTRGIYHTQIYHAKTALSGYFRIPKQFGLGKLEQYQFQQPYVVLSVSDMRGIESAVSLTIDGENPEVRPGTNIAFFHQGLHANIGALPQAGNKALNFDIKFELQGTGSLHFSPLGKSSAAQLTSDWPHPSFSGRFLPQQRDIATDGFSASWRTSDFATNMPSISNNCFAKSKCDDFLQTLFGVDFVDPVNLYVKTDRATKYALIFVLLTFVGVFLFEALKGLRVHPIQYGLVGVAIAMFYLLLLSFAEHMAFIWAYFISALACAGLIGSYVSYALSNWLRGLYFGSGLLFLYLLFYGLLSSEDYALLAGSLLAFAVLTTTMLTTKRIDWYTLGEQLSVNADALPDTHQNDEK